MADSMAMRARRRRAVGTLVGVAVSLSVVTVACGQSQPATKAASGTTSTSAADLPPAPIDGPELPDPKVRLLCPPAVIDLSGLDLPDDARPKLDHTSMERAGAQPASYDLTWQQGGRTIRLSYPGSHTRSMLLQPTETVELPEGRSAFIEFASDTSAYVSEAVGGKCRSYWISVDLKGKAEDPQDQARGFMIETAKTVRLRAPEQVAKVPDVVGLSPVDAQDRLARAGFIMSGDAGDAFALDLRKVAAQTPKGGGGALIGQEITISLTPQPTTTTAPPVLPEDVRIPMPTEPMTCPISRLRIDDTFFSQPTVAYGQTITWRQKGNYEPMLSWPSRESSNGEHGSRKLTVNGRPALMHDGGDGQNLVFDTGLPPGPCQFMQIGVFGGTLGDKDVFKQREGRATELATNGITLAPPPTAEPPNVVGKTSTEAADILARAGFIPDWGAHPALTDEPPKPPPGRVTAQQSGESGVILLTIATA